MISWQYFAGKWVDLFGKLGSVDTSLERTTLTCQNGSRPGELAGDVARIGNHGLQRVTPGVILTLVNYNLGLADTILDNVVLKDLLGKS